MGEFDATPLVETSFPVRRVSSREGRCSMGILREGKAYLAKTRGRGKKRFDSPRAIQNGKIDGGLGSDDHDLDSMSLRENSSVVGSDLVGGISIPDDSISSNDQRVDLVVLEKGSDHGVGEESGGDLEGEELEGGQTRSWR